MSASEKLIVLLKTLTQRTREGRAKWTPGSRDDTFVWSGSNASVAVLSADNDGQQPWKIQLFDSTGRVIEDEVFDPRSENYQIINDLYTLARSDALDITSAIDGLLDDLA